MARQVGLRIVTEVLGVEVGHWCNQCLLPSGYLVRYVVHTGPRSCLHSATGCTECEHDDVELVADPSTIWES